jgi:hypothetical protein
MVYEELSRPGLILGCGSTNRRVEITELGTIWNIYHINHRVSQTSYVHDNLYIIMMVCMNMIQ